MGYNELFRTFEYKNSELGSVANFAYEAAVNTAEEQSAGMTTGLDEHAQRRQIGWLDHISARIDGVASRPTPDLPATHPNLYKQEHVAPETITVDGIPLNHDTLTMSQMWQILANELLSSNSAGLGGGMHEPDADRAVNIVESMRQFLASLSGAPAVDFPETAAPAATKSKRK